MTEIQRNIIKRGKRNIFSRPFRTGDDEEAIAAWKLDLDKIRRVFEVESFLRLLHTIAKFPSSDRTCNKRGYTPP